MTAQQEIHVKRKKRDTEEEVPGGKVSSKPNILDSQKNTDKKEKKKKLQRE